MKSLALSCLSLALLAAAPAAAPKPVGPAGLVALLDARAAEPGVQGRYEMRVATAHKSPRATYLNSEADYRAAGNVSFALSPAAAAALAKRLGAEPEVALKGKHIVVDGLARRRAFPAGAPGQAARVSYDVRVDDAAQVVAID